MAHANRSTAHIFINTNKWFSAVSEYALQFASALRDDGLSPLCLSHPQSPLFPKYAKASLRSAELPLLGGFLGFVRSWSTLTKVLRAEKPLPRLSGGVSHVVDNFVDNHATFGIVWTFEGREHTLCALHRLVHRQAWERWKHVRVRGQAAPVRDTLFNRWVYRRGADALVVAADIVKRRIPFAAFLPVLSLFPFCSRFAHEASAAPLFGGTREPLARTAPVPFLANTPDIDPACPLFVVVGRFDPVKGHESLLRAFGDLASRQPPDSAPLQLVFAGRSENISAHSLVTFAAEAWRGKVVSHGSRFFVKGFDGRARLFVFDERVSDIVGLMSMAHFGVIPSLGSEVICRVAVEFLQCGTPLVSSTAGALAEIIPQDVGVFFTPGDDEDCRRALSEALSYAQVPAILVQFRRDAKAAGLGLYAAERYAELVHSMEKILFEGALRQEHS
ncbi:MAG: glycosyltransferase family 4 protein [Silvanigrellales bacterium]|nr:glycosyltransferase family 4 protein [Silvanigrellales bacterium]